MTPLGLSAWIVLPWLFVVGSILGSFLNVCIHRIPRHDSLWPQLRGLTSPPSSCPHCGRRIPRSDNIPILGWIKLGGRCRFCNQRIAIRYPMVELFNGLLFVVVYWFEVPLTWYPDFRHSCLYSAFLPTGATDSAWLSSLAVMHWRYAYHMLMLEALVVATFIDIDLRIIPDASTLPAMAVGVLGGFLLGRVHLVPVWYHDPLAMREARLLVPDWAHGLFSLSGVPAWIGQHPHLHGLAVSLAGVVVGGGIIWTVRLVGQWVLKQEAMGFGDVILMAMIGSFLGWQATVLIFFLAPFFALGYVSLSWAVRKSREIPYGPYLSFATLVVLLGWSHIWPRAERFFGLGPLLPVVAAVLAVALMFSLQLVQLGKWILGIRSVPELHYYWTEQWTPADQLTYLAGETVDAQQGRWKQNEWPGTASGRGAVFERAWRNGGKGC